MKIIETAMLGALLTVAGAAIFVYVSEPEVVQARAKTADLNLASPVQVARVEVSTVTDTIEAVGSLRSNEAAVISPEISGRIQTIDFDEGEPVSQGEKLLSLDDAIHQAEVAQARASLELSETNYERAEELLARGVGSVTARDEALAQLRVNEAGLALTQAQLAKMTIQAPFDGIIGLRTVSVGDYVVPGQDIVTLVDLDPIKVDFRVPETYLSKLREAQEVEITVDALPGETFEGEVYAIAPVIDVNGRAVQLRATLPNSDRRLQPGLFARVSVDVDTRKNAVLIDEAALIAQAGGNFVYQVRKGRARLTSVEVGLRRPGQVEIVEGLAVGARVVTAGQQRLDDGARVEIVGRVRNS